MLICFSRNRSLIFPTNVEIRFTSATATQLGLMRQIVTGASWNLHRHDLTTIKSRGSI